MRNNPLQHWEHLHPVVRPYFLKRVAIVGPEASGKSTLARNLAKHFGTVRVSDYAQTLLADYAANIPGFDAKSLDVHDMSTIARGQLASEDALAPQANRVIFCDTELLSISNRSRRLFGACPAWIEQVAAERKYDLYLLLGQKDRACEVAAWRAELIRRSTPFTIIDGNSWDERLQKAIASVHQRFPALS